MALAIVSLRLGAFSGAFAQPLPESSPVAAEFAPHRSSCTWADAAAGKRLKDKLVKKPTVSRKTLYLLSIKILKHLI
jgi:hypothetical protein